MLHPEKLPSAIERYNNQVLRILEVLNGWLEGKQWLVGNKMTYVDLAWAPWNDRLDSTLMVPPEKKFDGFPNVRDWHERITSRPSWKKAMEIRAKLMDEQGLTWTGMPKGMSSLADYEEHINATAENVAK